MVLSNGRRGNPPFLFIHNENTVGKVEKCYQKVIEYFHNIQDPITTAFWVRKTAEIIVKSTLLNENANADVDKRTYDLIRIIKKKKLAPILISQDMVNINNSTNACVHGDVVPGDIDILGIHPVIPHLVSLYNWYKEDVEPFTEEGPTPKYEIRMNKDHRTFSFVPKNP